jgi:hypothetical protein
MLELQTEASQGGSQLLQHGNPCVDNFWPDAVCRYRRNLVRHMGAFSAGRHVDVWVSGTGQLRWMDGERRWWWKWCVCLLVEGKRQKLKNQSIEFLKCLFLLNRALGVALQGEREPIYLPMPMIMLSQPATG